MCPDGWSPPRLLGVTREQNPAYRPSSSDPKARELHVQLVGDRFPVRSASAVDLAAELTESHPHPVSGAGTPAAGLLWPHVRRRKNISSGLRTTVALLRRTIERSPVPRLQGAIQTVKGEDWEMFWRCREASRVLRPVGKRVARPP